MEAIDKRQDKRRNAVIELTRMLCMFLIVVGHILGQGGVLDSLPQSSFIYRLIEILRILCLPATNIFVLISAYFMSSSRFKAKRFFTLWLQVFFYNLIAFGVSVAVGNVGFSLGTIIRMLFPISTNQYWYMRVFLGMMLLSPFLNYMIDSMNKKQHGACVAVSVVLFSIWRNLLPFSTTLNPEGGNSILWFITLYFIASYIRRYVEPSGKSKRYLCFSILAGIVTVGLYYITKTVSGVLELDGKGTSLFTEFTSVTITGISVAVFLMVLSIPDTFSDRTAKVINWMAASALSVYLIHEHSEIVALIKNSEFSAFMVKTPAATFPLVIAAAVIVFVTSMILDKLTFNNIKKLLNRAKFSRLQNKIDHILYSSKT